MPRYFFHIRTSEGMIYDPDGTELPDLGVARVEAELSARDLLADLLRRGVQLDGQIFEISDENGKVLEQVPFRSVLRF